MEHLMQSEVTESVEQFASAWKLILRDLPGADLTDRLGLAVRWADSSFPFWNAIFLNEPATDGDVLQSRLRRASAYMREKRHSGLIWVFEEYLSGSAKERLAEILEGEKLELALPAIGMAGNIFPLQAPAHPVLRVKRVKNVAMIEEFAEINCEAYGFPAGAGRSALEPRLWVEESYSYLGFENDRAVCAASVIVNEECLFLALVATRPGARKKGYAEAIVRHALQRAHKATGLMRTILHATEAGHPVYKRVGYHDTARILAYRASA
jgi:GNAT superfamily N-acetyltransferase